MNQSATIPTRTRVKHLHREAAKKPVGPFFKPVIQTKLSINQPGDVYEQEADAMADKVMRMSDKDVMQTNPAPVSIQKKCAACEEEEKLQLKDDDEQHGSMQLKPIAELPVQRKCEHCEEEEKLQLKETDNRNDKPVQLNPVVPDVSVQRKCEHCEEEEKLQLKENDDQEETMQLKPIAEIPIQRKCEHCEEEEKMQRKEDNETEDKAFQLNPIPAISVQRKCAECEEEEEKVHRKESGYSPAPLATHAVYETVRSAGNSLDKNTRSFMESRFNYDFSKVRIHNNTKAHESSASISAKAYTLGQDIVFGRGQYQPDTHEGKQLLAHELTHVIQQAAGKVSRKMIQRAQISHRQITWADFLGPVPKSIGKEGAGISSGFDIQYPSFTTNTKDKKTKCKVDGKASTDFEATESVNYADADKIQPYMEQGASWVLDRFKNPGPAYCNSQVTVCQSQLTTAQSEASQSCVGIVKACEDAFNKEHKTKYGINIGGRDIIAKNTYDCKNSFQTTCQQQMSKGASITVSGIAITSPGDCKTKYFPKCLTDDKIENARLLKHEQGHFDITKVIADKARNDLKARASAANLTATGCGSKQATAAATALSDKLYGDLKQAGPAWQKLKSDTQDEYDVKTVNGTDTSQQGKWETDIKAGLTKYTIPPATAAPPAAPTKPTKPAPTPTPKPTPGFQRKCAHCEEEEKLQMKEATAANYGMPASTTVYQAISSGGQSIDAGVKSFMESRIGYDFSRVQIHNDALAHQSSAEINARAYTLGNHVVFGKGEYQPNAETGKKLLAHELTHVVQQNGVTDDQLHPSPQKVMRDTKPAPAPKITIATINAPNTPAKIKRIIPSKELEVDIKAINVDETVPVELSIDGTGGDNGSAKINNMDTYNLKTSEKIKIKGVDQTEPGHAANLSLVGKQGGKVLKRSNPFSVAAYPEAVGFKFHGWLSGAKLRRIPGLHWGASYETEVTCDSGNFADCNKTSISENVAAVKHTGLFESLAIGSSDFNNSTARQIDYNAVNSDSAEELKKRIDKADIAKSVVEVKQFFRFACRRTGIEEDLKRGPKVPTSGFKLTHKIGKYFVKTQREGFANSGVAAGTVDDDKEKKSDIT